MTNYQNAKIYLITSPNTDLVYVGGTVKPLDKCMKEWKAHVLNLNPKYLCMDSPVKKVASFGDARIELLHPFPCTTKKELNTEVVRVLSLFKKRAVNIHFNPYVVETLGSQLVWCEYIEMFLKEDTKSFIFIDDLWKSMEKSELPRPVPDILFDRRVFKQVLQWCKVPVKRKMIDGKKVFVVVGCLK